VKKLSSFEGFFFLGLQLKQKKARQIKTETVVKIPELI
jgi:hypothetical protein